MVFRERGVRRSLLDPAERLVYNPGTFQPSVQAAARYRRPYAPGGMAMTYKPSEREEEFFARQEFAKKQKLEEERQKQLAETERQKAKDLHWMKCPKCGMNLVEIDYRSLKIDKCSSCQGVWLDAGELEQVAKLEKGALDKLFSVFSK
jgi:hypothetical protein